MQPELSDGTTVGVEHCLRELGQGNDRARDQLIEVASRRLRRLAQSMLRDHPSLARWEEVDDVFQRGIVRLWQALRDCHPQSSVQFYRLAAQVLRRELIDLARHYFGPQGVARHLTTPHWDSSSGAVQGNGCQGDSTWNAASLQPWTEFHEAVETLPDELRAAFDLLWYQGLAQTEAASLLAISERTLQRRWHEARVAIYQRLNPAD